MTNSHDLLCIDHDVTQRCCIEQERLGLLRRQQKILDSMFAFVGLYSPEGILIDANRTSLEAAGVQREDAIGKPLWELPYLSYSAEVQSQVRAALCRAAQGESVREDFLVRVGEGVLITVDASFGPIRNDAGEVTLVVGSGVDVSERKQAETALRISEERLKEAQRIGQIGSWELDLQTDELHWSAETYRIFEIDEQQCSASLAVFRAHLHPEDRKSVMGDYARSIETRQPYDFTHRLLMPDGRVKYVQERAETEYNAAGTPLRSMGTIQDITERTQLLKQLFEAQKLESIGKLAGGIAHDFNNLLTAITGYTELAQESVDADSETACYLSNVQAAAQRAVALTSQLLMYARRQMVEFNAVSLNAVILGLDPILRRTIGESYELVLALDERLWTVRSNTSQLEQVLMNLVVNARDAMPEGGRIHIESRNLALGSKEAEGHPGVMPGEYAVLSVSDCGPGIAKEIRDQIFEPFFTTKEIGKGTGLGLATCYGIVKQSRGFLTFHSEPVRGTIFRVYLPRLHSAPDIVAEAAPLELLPSGSETVLLADDEPMVRDIAARILRSQGYLVLEATNAAEAMHIQAEWGGDIDLLVTDVVMPLMGGKELAQRLRQSRPDIKVLYLSGYAHDVVRDQDISQPDDALMTKPFSSSALVKRVREVLSSD